MPDPLHRIEQQVAIAAHRYAERQTRRRRTAIFAVTLTLMVGGASAASAITGVGPVKHLAGKGQDPTMEPVDNEPRIYLAQTDSAGNDWTMRAFRAQGTTFCLQAPPLRSTPASAASCAPYDVIASELQRDGAYVTVLSPDEGKDVALVVGLTRGDTTAIEVTDSDGRPWRGAISPIWVDAPSGTLVGTGLRACLIVVEGSRPHSQRPLRVDVALQDGSSLSSVWPDESLRGP